jgi:hypothetical protein
VVICVGFGLVDVVVVVVVAAVAGLVVTNFRRVVVASFQCAADASTTRIERLNSCSVISVT